MSDIKQSGVETFQRCFPRNPGKFCTLFNTDWDQNEEDVSQYQGQLQSQDGYTMQDRETGEILNISPNAYGLSVSSDQYGRAIKTDPSLRVTPDAYGPGIGMDQYGRQVR